MALYAIGDIQGCLDDLERLLQRIAFDAQHDTVWFTGDLVNRGPRSLDTLRFVRSLGDSAVTVLGNHDLHLIAAAAGAVDRKHAQSLADVLNAPDCDQLVEWLCAMPLAHADANLQLLLVHAGVHPEWSDAQALACAREVEDALQSESRGAFLEGMYGNRPRRWRNSLEGVDRLRTITNIFTRMRYLDEKNRLSLKFKGPPGEQPDGLVPWFEADSSTVRTSRIIFGHWSSLGVIEHPDFIGLDSGCLWGRCLTAVRLTPAPTEFFNVDCAQHHESPG